jgi:hypothetical protein
MRSAMDFFEDIKSCISRRKLGGRVEDIESAKRSMGFHEFSQNFSLLSKFKLSFVARSPQ